MFFDESEGRSTIPSEEVKQHNQTKVLTSRIREKVNLKNLRLKINWKYHYGYLFYLLILII